MSEALLQTNMGQSYYEFSKNPWNIPQDHPTRGLSGWGIFLQILSSVVVRYSWSS